LIKMPSPAMVVAVMALVVALGGSAWAVSKIGTNQIKNKAVTTPKLGNNAVSAAKLKAGAVTGPKIANRAVTAGKLGTVPAVTLEWTKPNTAVEDEFEFPLFNGWTEQLDTANMWPGQDGGVTAPLDGVYRVDAQVFWSSNANGTRRVFIRNFEAPNADRRVGSIVAGDNGDAVQYAGGLIRADAGDRFFVYVWQDSGTNLFIGNNSALVGGTKFSVQYVGPAG
jgi:hypothetical protein